MSLLIRRLGPSMFILTTAVAGSSLALPTPGVDAPYATLAVQPVQAISAPDLRLDLGQPAETDGLDMGSAELKAPCRSYADEPSAQPNPGFAECWNEKKTAWYLTKPSAIGLSLPQMNTPLNSASIKSGAPRETPVP